MRFVVRSGRDALTVPVSSVVASRTSAGVPSSDPLSALKMRARARGKYLAMPACAARTTSTTVDALLSVGTPTRMST